MARKKEPPPAPEEQLELRARLEELRTALTSKAVLLVRSLRPPKPDPAELVAETVRRLLGRYTDAQLEKVQALAFVTLTNIACDIARKGRRFDGGLIEDDGEVVDPQPRETDPFVKKVIGMLPDRERCVVLRIVLEDVAVPEAFKTCGWDTPSPYPEYKKILKKLKKELEGPHE